MVAIAVGQKRFEGIEAIFFDKDGTLADSGKRLRELSQKRARLLDAQFPGIGEPLLLAFGVQGSVLDPAGLMAVGSVYENEIAAAAYIAETGRGWLEARAATQAAFAEADRQFAQEPDPLFPGSLEVLQRLAQTELKLGILSAATMTNVQEFVAQQNLGAYFQVSIGVEPGGLDKPDPKFFQFACQELGVDPGKTLMVGDAAGDIQMAQAAGAAGTIAISWGATAPPSSLAAADLFISELSALSIG
ncbi:MAG: HAD family hydrolase [Cyanobacteria bacterium J06641_5]